MSTGTTLVLAPAASMTWTGSGSMQSFELGSGGVRAHVAKLQPGARFVVHTADAEVEVHGTVFDVDVVPPDPTCGAGTPTRVRVREGVVSVRVAGVETRVTAGESWPAGCPSHDVAPPIAPIVAASAAPAPSATSPVVAVVATAPRVAASSAPSVAPPVDTLGAKNDLFARALSARRRGDVHAALDGFSSYLALYPSGELAESASAERMMLLRKVDAMQAAAAARDYLARWPGGFARADADAIVAAGAAPAP
jgi:hypothetical protein